MYVDCDQTCHGHVFYGSLLLREGWTTMFRASSWYPILMTIPVFYSSHEPCLWRSRIYEPPESQVIVKLHPCGETLALVCVSILAKVLYILRLKMSSRLGGAQQGRSVAAAAVFNKKWK